MKGDWLVVGIGVALAVLLLLVLGGWFFMASSPAPPMGRPMQAAPPPVNLPRETAGSTPLTQPASGPTVETATVELTEDKADDEPEAETEKEELPKPETAAE